MSQDGKTALINAAVRGCLDVVKALVTAGADLAAKDKVGGQGGMDSGVDSGVKSGMDSGVDRAGWTESGVNKRGG